jgi:uncharacterized protein
MARIELRAMNVLVSGASGLVGSELVPALAASGHKVMRLVRHKATPGAPELAWDPSGPPTPDLFAGFDAVVHLAGETIMGRWTDAKKERIRRSRVEGTRQIAESLAQAKSGPRVLVQASAIGYYGNNRDDELLHEESAPGKDFLAETCQQWEGASAPAEQAGVRVVRFRIGMILSPKGGALKQMLLPFRLGLGGRIGSGRQWMSWVALDDVVGAIEFALTHESVRGAVNLVAPEPALNRDFTAALAKAVHRPTIFPVPKLAVHVLFGEMGDTLLLASQRVEPRKLRAAGYHFQCEWLEGTLREMVRRK